jgi:hypothetical protein
MDPTLQTIINVGAIAGALSTLIGFWIAAVKLWPHIKRGVAVASELERLPEIAAQVTNLTQTQAAQTDVLETIRHEVEFNNGSSVKDAITRIEKRLDDPPQPQTTINVNPAGGTP